MRPVEVCYMTEIYSDVLSKLARMTAPIAPTDILIVGDDAPRLWSKVGGAGVRARKGLLGEINTPRAVARQRIALNDSLYSARPAVSIFDHRCGSECRCRGFQSLSSRYTCGGPPVPSGTGSVRNFPSTHWRSRACTGASSDV